jgi:phage gp46-like protein
MARGGKRDGAGRPQGAVNKATASIREAAQEYSAQALQVLVNVATSGESEAARVSAANAILDRAHGKPSQAVELDGTLKATIEAIEWRVVDPSA